MAVDRGGPVLFRADASAALGMGHLIRLAAVADAIARRGTSAVFLVRDDEAARSYLRQQQMAFECLPAALTMAQDAVRTSTFAAQVHADAIMTDICTTAALKDPAAIARFHQKLKGSGAPVVCFCGADYIDPAADVVVSPYVGAHRFASAGSTQQLQLLGPDYFVFHGQFAGTAAAPRNISAIADRVLVTIGGGDPTELTATALEALARLAEPPPYIRIVLGPGFPEDYRRRLRQTASSLAGRVEWLNEAPDMAGLMCWADLAITGDGLTKYETAVTGTPSIMLSRPDSPQFMNDQFALMETTLHLQPGEYDGAAGLAREIDALRRDAGRRADMSRRGRELLDTKGVGRLLAAIGPVRARTLHRC